MCGINGIVANSINQDSALNILKKMNDSIAHRGPDAEGIWNKNNIYLGHRRLSIIDVSPASNQPMLSNDGRWVIVYNGELYNYKEIKFELQRAQKGELPYVFRTNSDTEVILAAFNRWGINCLDKFNGMFAFAIYDNQLDELYLVRDRLGIKPLYYSHNEKEIVFSSEIRAIIKSKLVEKEINTQSLIEYVQYQTVHAPNTIIKNIFMLMPGHYAKIKNNELEKVCWWDIKSKANKNIEVDYTTATKKVSTLLHESVEKRMIADVPFGAFLSGGIDSSAIVGLMAGVSSKPIETFSVTFNENEFSEENYSGIISKRFNTNHHEIKLCVTDFLNELPNALNAMDHPSGDGPNTYIVSKSTKQQGISMALSGLGSDELFGGYEVFKRAFEIKQKAWMNIIPGLFRKTASALMNKKTIATDKKAQFLSKPILNFDYFYPLTRAVFNDSQTRGLVGINELPFNPVYKTVRLLPTNEKNHLISKCSQAEISTYMQNVLLRDTDQMSMAVALEVRVPFLDYKLVEYTLGLPDENKSLISSKKLLTDSLKDLLPNEIIERKKMGFVLPWQVWMKNELKSFCEENLNELKKRTSLNAVYLDSIWKRFLQDDALITWSRIWHLVVLGHWLKKMEIEK